MYENCKCLQAAEMKSLIGFFDLDPTRVFDIILDAFQQQPRTDIFTRFIPHFSARVIAQNLGFKFQQAHVSSEHCK